MNQLNNDPRPDKSVTDQEKNVLPDPENVLGNQAAEATEFLDEDLRMNDQPFENPE